MSVCTRNKTFVSMRKIINNTITQFQVWNCKYLMLSNRSINNYLAEKKGFHHNKKHKNTFTQLQVCKRKEVMLPKEKHITSLNAFVHLMKFSCIIFHLFSNVLQVLFHVTHYSGRNIYAFGRILDCLVQPPNYLTLIVN